MTWVAVSDAAVVGYATASPVFSTWQATDYLHLDCLYLDAEHRGQGGGRLIISAIYEYARANNFPWIEWQTPTWNSNAIRFYERLGATNTQKARFSIAVEPESD
jgi:GNAT superfamily N-acetyltransferase